MEIRDFALGGALEVADVFHNAYVYVLVTGDGRGGIDGWLEKKLRTEEGRARECCVATTSSKRVWQLFDSFVRSWKLEGAELWRAMLSESPIVEIESPINNKHTIILFARFVRDTQSL